MPATVETNAMPKLPTSWFVRAVASLSPSSKMKSWMRAQISETRVKSKPR